MNQINLAEIKRFFNLIDPQETVWTVCFLDKNSRENIPGYGTVIAPLEEILKVCEGLDAAGTDFTLHFNVNRTKVSGRKKADIESARVFALDLDSGEVSDEWLQSLIDKYRPTCVVRSSPGKFHVYWRCSSGIGLELWSKVQLALATAFQGDTNLEQTSKTLRVPGVDRLTKTGERYMPSIYFFALEPEITDVSERFPDWQNWYEQGLKNKAVRRTQQKKTRENFKQGKPINVNPGGRNSTLYDFVLREASAVTVDEDLGEGASGDRDRRVQLLERAKELNGQFQPPLDEREVENTFNSAFEVGIKRWEEKVTKIMGMGAMPENSGAESSSLLGVDSKSSISVEESQPENGELSGSKANKFQYDFEKGRLAIAPFSDEATIERIEQRFCDYFTMIDGTLFVFNDTNITWKRDLPSNPILTCGYVSRCIDDVVLSPAFIDTYGSVIDKVSGEKELSVRKLNEARNKWYKVPHKISIAKGVFLSDRLPQKKLEDFDAKLELFYCKNGLLNLFSGEIRAAKATDYLLHQANVLWPEKTPDYSEWVEWLRSVFSENEDTEGMINLLQEIFGYSLTGSIRCCKLFLHQGTGSNGKTLVLTALRKLVGAYHTIISGEHLSKAKGAMQKELERVGAQIEGARVVIVPDLPVDTTWNEGHVKILTESYVPARNLYKEAKAIPNRAKFHIGCNRIPKIEAENHGIERRLCVIPYNKRFPQSMNKEMEIVKMIDRNLSGILCWAVEGAQKLAFKQTAEGSPIPFELEDVAESKAVMKEYKQENFKVQKDLITKIENLFEKVPKDCDYPGMNIEKIMEYLPGESSRHVGDLLTNELEIPKKRIQENKRKFTKYFLRVKADS